MPDKKGCTEPGLDKEYSGLGGFVPKSLNSISLLGGLATLEFGIVKGLEYLKY